MDVELLQRVVNDPVLQLDETRWIRTVVGLADYFLRTDTTGMIVIGIGAHDVVYIFSLDLHRTGLCFVLTPRNDRGQIFFFGKTEEEKRNDRRYLRNLLDELCSERTPQRVQHLLMPCILNLRVQLT